MTNRIDWPQRNPFARRLQALLGFMFMLVVAVTVLIGASGTVKGLALLAGLDVSGRVCLVVALLLLGQAAMTATLAVVALDTRSIIRARKAGILEATRRLSESDPRPGGGDFGGNPADSDLH